MIKEILKGIEIYQDVELNGEFVKGVRNCEDRWGMIKNSIDDNSTIIEVGSAQGWFTKKLSEKNNIVLSFERHRQNIALQKRLFSTNKNILIFNKELGTKDLYALSGVVEAIDYFIMLGVLHYFDNPELVVSLISQISPNLIVEIPSEDEKGVAHLSNIKKIKKIDFGLYFKNEKFLGVVNSHLGGGQRVLMHYWNDEFSRIGLQSYIDKSILLNNHELSYSYGSWELNGDKILTPAFNVYNALKLGMVHPSREVVAENAVKAYELLEKKSDVRVWNLLFSLSGLKAIDYLDENDITKFKEGDLDRLRESILNHV